MRVDPKTGEIWFVDLGLAEKSRPVLILSIPSEETARALIIVAPLNSQIRGLLGEVDIGKPRWLPKRSAVNLQGLASIDRSKLSRRMGKLSGPQMVMIKDALRSLLGL